MSIEEEFLAEIPNNKIKPKNRKKGINSKKKGSSWELEVVHRLNERFKGYIFARSVQSGAYTGGLNSVRTETLTEDQLLVFVGDIRVPKNFIFAIECKAYNKIDFWEMFNSGSNLNNFLEQARIDADKISKIPMLIFKANNKPPIVFTTINTYDEAVVFKYEEWFCYRFNDLFSHNDGFFFIDSKE
jgi:hypothetical protein